MNYQKQIIKEFLALTARTLLVLVMFALSCVAFVLTWWVNRLQAADLWIVTWAAGFPKIDTTPISAPDNMTQPGDPTPVPVPLDKASLPDLDEILMSIRIRPKFWVNNVRRAMEDSEVGRRAKANCKDRRLYAVLKPTKEENLRRIENIFRAMTTEQFEHARQLSKEHLGL